MNRAKDVLFRITLPVAIIYGTGFLVAAIVCFVLGNPAQTQYLISEVEAGRITTSFPGTIEEQVASIQLMCNILGGCYILPVVCAIMNAILSTIALNKESRVFYILNIIFGIGFLDVPTNAVASIFGLILLGRKERAKKLEETK